MNTVADDGFAVGCMVRRCCGGGTWLTERETQNQLEKQRWGLCIGSDGARFDEA